MAHGCGGLPKNPSPFPGPWRGRTSQVMKSKEEFPIWLLEAKRSIDGSGTRQLVQVSVVVIVVSPTTSSSLQLVNH